MNSEPKGRYIILANNFREARSWAMTNRIPSHCWIYARDSDSLLGLTGFEVITLEGFHENSLFHEIREEVSYGLATGRLSEARRFA